MGIASMAEGRKIISIGARTWERLKKLGEYERYILQSSHGV